MVCPIAEFQQWIKLLMLRAVKTTIPEQKELNDESDLCNSGSGA